MKRAMVHGAMLLLCASTGIGADSLRFTSGSVGNYSTVSLELAGPAEMIVQVERLNRTNAAWEAQGTVALTNGTGQFNSTLIEGIYGFFRAQGTNGGTLYRSTNAFGAVAGYLEEGYSLIGNMFAACSLTNIVREPTDGTQASKWSTASNSWTTTTYDLGWSPEPFTVEIGEGFMVDNNSTNTLRYLVSGLFDTNSIFKSIPSGKSILCTPLYHIQHTNSWIVDTLDTNLLGGSSLLPVRTGGFDPQSTIKQLISSSGSYQTNILTSSNQWESAGTNVIIYLEISEGFWLEKPTNATWTVNRPIW